MLVSWSWEWASCTIFSRAAVDTKEQGEIMTTFVKKLPANTIGRDFTIGDLHGCYDLLMEKMQLVGFDKSKDRLFSVGDLTDRGPDSMKCLGLLNEPWLFAVQGNHDRMMMCYCGFQYSAYHSPRDFINNGGEWIQDPTITDGMREAWCRIMEEKMPIVFDVGTGPNGFKITHAYLYSAKVNPDLAVWDRSLLDEIHYSESFTEEMVKNYKENCGQFFQLSKRDKRKKVVFVGHNTLLRGNIIMIDNHVMIDQGAYRKMAHPTEGYDLTIVNTKEVIDKLK